MGSFSLLGVNTLDKIYFPTTPQQIVDFISYAIHKQSKIAVSYSDKTGEIYNWSELGFNPKEKYPLRIDKSYFLPSGHSKDKVIIGMSLTDTWR